MTLENSEQCLLFAFSLLFCFLRNSPDVARRQEVPYFLWFNRQSPLGFWGFFLPFSSVIKN